MGISDSEFIRKLKQLSNEIKKILEGTKNIICNENY